MIFKITGQVRESERKIGVPNLVVRAFDKDLIYDDLLGSVTTDEKGCFEIIYEETDYKELFEKQPDIYLTIKSPDYRRVLHTTEEKVRFEADKEEHFIIDIPRRTLGDLAPPIIPGGNKMSYAKLNIWLRYADCSLIWDCWRTDLVIKTCGGEPLVDMDPTVIEKLKAKYGDYQEVIVHDYAGERRIKLWPGGGRHVYHIEVDVPPGCYVVWTRVCYKNNEETNKVMVIVDCGGEVCVNLLLDAVETCSNEIFHPLLERLVELPKYDLQVVAKGLMVVAEKPKKEVVAELDQRLGDAKQMGDKRLQDAIGRIMDIVKAMPDGIPCK